jgi:hypothetical protein
VAMQKRRETSARPHAMGKKERLPLAGPEPLNGQARSLNNVTGVLDVPDEVSNAPGATREEFVRRARLLLHYTPQ